MKVVIHDLGDEITYTLGKMCIRDSIGTETRPRLLREAAVGDIAQWAKA